MTFALILDSFVSLAVTSNASNIILITFPKKGLLKIDDLQLTSNRPRTLTNEHTLIVIPTEAFVGLEILESYRVRKYS